MMMRWTLWITHFVIKKIWKDAPNEINSIDLPKFTSSLYCLEVYLVDAVGSRLYYPLCSSIKKAYSVCAILFRSLTLRPFLIRETVTVILSHSPVKVVFLVNCMIAPILLYFHRSYKNTDTIIISRYLDSYICLHTKINYNFRLPLFTKRVIYI